MYYTQYHNARAYCHKDEYLSSLPLVILLFIIIIIIYRFYLIFVTIT